MAPYQADIKDSALYIANRKAYETYDEEDKKPYKYQFRTRRRKADGAGFEEPEEKKAEPAAPEELPLIEPKVRIYRRWLTKHVGDRFKVSSSSLSPGIRI